MTSPGTRITTPFTATSTTNDVLANVDLTGKRVVVTGASSGLGVETARALASVGVEVTLVVRDTEVGEQVARDITSKTSNANVFVMPLDLNSHASITAFTKAWKGPLHILVNNAGISALPELTLTPEGWEQHFATNHLGHFELALSLHDALAAAGNARIVSSKTANILFAVEASKRWAKEGIAVNACHPGVVRTKIFRHMKRNAEFQKLFDAANWRSVECGACPQVLLAASPLVEGIHGRYFEDNNEAEIVPSEALQPRESGVRLHAIDADEAARLWDASLEMLKQRTSM